MYVRSSKSVLLDGNRFVTSRSDLTTLLAMADAIAKLPTKDLVLKDEIVFENGRFKLAWAASKGGGVPTADQVRDLERDISTALTHCQSRRADATKNNRAIHELPTDAKMLALNKALYVAGRANCSLNFRGAGPLPAFDPAELLLQTPEPELKTADVDCIVSGSNVVGGVVQLDLLEETKVDVVYFIHNGPCQQVRASVPLRLSNVRNLVTRIRVRCTYSAESVVYYAANQPCFYHVQDGQEIPL
ncbi:MAG TPA: hypothetical protein VFN29_08460 [Chiayiivirga sp.]|nr:hypothetical protein [Chiayiivirga sp.]